MKGTPVARSFVVMMHTGTAVIDWGNGVYLDILNGSFFRAEEKEVSHRAHESDLDWLMRLGHVEEYDDREVFFSHLPEYPRNLAD